MQKALLVLLGLAATTSAMEVEPINQREIKRNTFGAMEVTDWIEEGFRKTVLAPEKFLTSYSQQAQFIKDANEQMKVNAQRIKDGSIYRCSTRGNDPSSKGTDPAEFLPVYLGDLSKKGQTIDYGEGICFKSLKLSYDYTTDAADGTLDEVMLTVTAEQPKSLFCHEWMFFGNTEMLHLENIFKRGKHVITFKNLSPEAKIDVARNGVKGYLFCDGWVDSFVSVFKWIMAFGGGIGLNPNLPIIGSHVPEYMIKQNQVFIKDNMEWTLEERKTHEVPVDESLIQSGDFFAVTRLDGLDPLVMVGTGSHAGHSVMAMRFDGELYICESQDGWYWPVHGIQRNKFSTWMQFARNADFHVNWMPLNAETRAKWNETAAHEFFNKTVGLPYGYHNFLYGWIDTPNANFPPLLAEKIVPIVFEIVEKISPKSSDLIFSSGLNARLGTKDLKIAELAAKAAEQNMTLSEAMAIPEKDHTVYHGEEPRDGWSYVCSAFVAAVYKAAGLFDDLEINATEFLPIDVYTLNFFQTADQRPQVCKDADPTSDSCQILGRFRMTHPRFNSMAPFSHMAESCPTVAPKYERPDKC